MSNETMAQTSRERTHWTAHPRWGWLWGLLATIVALTSLVIQTGIAQTLGIGQRQRALTVVVTEVRALAAISDPEERPNADLTFAGESISALFLVTSTITNTGSDPLPAQDFEQPLSISVPSSYVLVDATDSVGNGAIELPSIVHTSMSEISLRPVLLNPGDQIQLSLVVSSAVSSQPPVIRADAHIIGLTQIDVVSQPTRASRSMQDLIVVALLISALLLFSIPLAGMLSRAILAHSSSSASIQKDGQPA